jgi:hypothetical protein
LVEHHGRNSQQPEFVLEGLEVVIHVSDGLNRLSRAFYPIRGFSGLNWVKPPRQAAARCEVFILIQKGRLKGRLNIDTEFKNRTTMPCFFRVWPYTLP